MVIRGSNSSSVEVRERATYKPGVKFVELREVQKMQKAFINKPKFTCHSLLISQNLFSIQIRVTVREQSNFTQKYLGSDGHGALGNCVLLLVCKVKCFSVYLLNSISFLFSRGISHITQIAALDKDSVRAILLQLETCQLPCIQSYRTDTKREHNVL